MKNVLLLITIIASGFISTAQHHSNPPPSREAYEKMRTHKIAYLSGKLELTPEEAQRFWPIYNEMEQKLYELREANRPEKGKKLNEMSNTEIESRINQRFEFREQELNLEKDYYEKFKQVISLEKIVKLYRAEETFRRELLKKLKEGKKGNGPPPNEKRP